MISLFLWLEIINILRNKTKIMNYLDNGKLLLKLIKNVNIHRSKLKENGKATMIFSIKAFFVIIYWVIEIEFKVYILKFFFSITHNESLNKIYLITGVSLYIFQNSTKTFWETKDKKKKKKEWNKRKGK